MPPQADVKCSFYCFGKKPDFPSCQQRTLETSALLQFEGNWQGQVVKTLHKKPFRPLPGKYIYIKYSIPHPGLRQTAFLPKRSSQARPAHITAFISVLHVTSNPRFPLPVAVFLPEPTEKPLFEKQLITG